MQKGQGRYVAVTLRCNVPCCMRRAECGSWALAKMQLPEAKCAWETQDLSVGEAPNLPMSSWPHRGKVTKESFETRTQPAAVLKEGVLLARLVPPTLVAQLHSYRDYDHIDPMERIHYLREPYVLHLEKQRGQLTTAPLRFLETFVGLVFWPWG